jgi:hypothetical protein
MATESAESTEIFLCLFILEPLNKSSPRKRGSSNLLILRTLDSRLRGDDRLVQTILLHIGAQVGLNESES